MDKKRKFLIWSIAAVCCVAIAAVWVCLGGRVRLGPIFSGNTFKDCSGVVYRERIYPSSAGIVKKFILFEDGSFLDDFARHPNMDEKKTDGRFALSGMLMVAEKGDTVYYRKWSDGKTEITDIRFVGK